MSDEIERLAEAFLAGVPAHIWDGRSLPVPVEEIADSHAGLLVRDVDDLAAAPGAPPLDDGQTLSGLLLPGLGEIWVNAAEAQQWPARRRFTIAHELGHWRLHRGEGFGAYCRSAAVADAAAPPRLHPREAEANAFAAALLMPAALVQRHYRRYDHDFSALCRTFGASGAAMGRRLHAVIR